MKTYYILLLCLLACSSCEFKESAGAAQTHFRVYEKVAYAMSQESPRTDSLLKQLLDTTRQRVGNNDTTLAIIYHKMAVNYFNWDKFHTALTYFDSALKLRERHLPPNHVQIAQSYTMIAATLKQVKNYRGAIQYFDKALKINQLNPNQDTISMSRLLFGLGDIYNRLGDSEAGDGYLKHALQYMTVQDDNYASCQYYLGINYRHLKKDSFAIKHFKIALNVLTDSSDRADVYHNWGMTLMDKAQYDDALIQLNQALSIYKQLKYSELSIANTYIEIARTYLHQHKYEQALEAATKSLSLRQQKFEKNFKHFQIAESHTLLGDIAAARNDLITALSRYQIAIDAFDERTFTPVQQIEPLFGKAKMLLQLGRKKDALFVFNTLDSVIQTVTHEFREDKSKFNLLENHFGIYEKAIQTAFELFELNQDSTLLQQAFQFSSHSKAVALQQAVSDEKAKFFANIPKDILEKEHSLKQELAFQQKQCVEDTSKKNYTENYTLLYHAKEKLNVFVADLEKKYPKYYDLKYQSAQVIDLKRLQKSLPNEMMSLEFFAGDSTIYTFAITRNQLKNYQLSLTKDFDTTISQVRKSLVEANPNLKKDYLNGADRLYELLLKQPLNDLNANHQITRLRIIPDGKLGYIPFDALLTAPATDWLDRYDKKVPFLLRDYSTSYAYYSDSALNQKAITVKGDFQGFGIDYKDSLTNKSLKNKYGYLEEAPREVDTIRHFIGGKTWKNEDATKKCFLQNATKSGILHLSMHSTTNDKNPLESQLIFSKNDSTDDNLLIGNELFAQQFTCGLAVLSACHTGDGLMQRGEGIMSLARAFAYSGCPSLVMSLWSIPDRSTSNIMLHFYQNLKQNLPKDVALQQSKLNYLDNQSFQPSQKTPNFWAATVIIGDVNELHFEKWYEQYWVILLIITVLGVVFISRLRCHIA
jgi:CHAT domain-containing protein